MTPDAVNQIVDAIPMPSGLSLVVRPQRKHMHRNLWSIQVHEEGRRIWGRAYYNVAAGIRAAQQWAWEQAA